MTVVKANILNIPRTEMALYLGENEQILAYVLLNSPEENRKCTRFWALLDKQLSGDGVVRSSTLPEVREENGIVSVHFPCEAAPVFSDSFRPMVVEQVREATAELVKALW